MYKHSMSEKMTLSQLEHTPENIRDLLWIEKYTEVLKDTPLTVLNDQPQEGPDGFSYLLVGTRGKGQETLKDLIQWGADKGIGFVFNPEKSSPDLILTYGMLWNYLVQEEFLSNVEGPISEEIIDGELLYTGVPTEEYWPKRARQLFKEFLLAQGVLDPQMVLVMRSKEDTGGDICLSIESLGNPPKEEWDGLLQAFSWFFPRHYSLSLVSKKNLPEAPFTSV